jgi:hypothetical protein
MGVSEKERRPLVSGGFSKKERSVFEVHHKHGIPSLGDLRLTLGEYTYGMLYGEMEILCFSCHKLRTHDQAKKRHEKK